MKKKYLFLTLAVLLGTFVSGQHLRPSTMRQIFDFAPGDTLEYSYTYSQYSIFTGVYTMTGTSLFTIRSRQMNGNNLYYTVKVDSELIFPPINGGNMGSSYRASGIGSWMITDLDSGVFWRQPSLPWGCDTVNHCINDSIYIDSTMQSRKVNLFYDSWLCCFNRDTAYADGLGQILAVYGDEDYAQTQGRVWLSYYHKANGDIWGSPHYFTIPNGLAAIADHLFVTVSPNPTQGDINVSFDGNHADSYWFVLTDVTGRELMSEAISPGQTQIKRGGIAAGSYIWHISAKAAEMASGKIIFR